MYRELMAMWVDVGKAKMVHVPAPPLLGDAGTRRVRGVALQDNFFYDGLTNVGRWLEARVRVRSTVLRHGRTRCHFARFHFCAGLLFSLGIVGSFRPNFSRKENLRRGKDKGPQLMVCR